MAPPSTPVNTALRPMLDSLLRVLGGVAAVVLASHLHAQAASLVGDGAGRAPVARLFVSGHSLTDPPLPDSLALIAESLGHPLQWNMQSLPGSSIRERAGSDAAGRYRHGANRQGRDMNVLAEWQRPRTVTGGAYDALLVAEQHGVLTALTYQDTTSSLADIHRRFVDANPRGRVWLYEAWLGVHDKSDPARWIAYERAASPVWQCVAARATRTLEAMGRPSAIGSVPAGAALAWFVGEATRGHLDGVSAASPRETMDRLFVDEVHLTPLGQYFVAAVVYAVIWNRSPMGAAAPQGIDAHAALTLQEAAWRFVDRWRGDLRPVSFEACRDHVRQRFIGQHWAYVRDAVWARESGALSAWSQWARQVIAWHLRVRRSGLQNPFRD